MKQKINHKVPEGYRRLRVGELIIASDSIRAKACPHTNDMVTTVCAGCKVEPTDGNCYYRKIAAKKKKK